MRIEKSVTKKVCFIAPIERVFNLFLIQHAQKLMENGYEITLISDFSVEFSELYKRKMNIINIRIDRNANLANLINSILILTRILKHTKYDFIQYTGPSTSLICSIAGILSNTKIRIYCLWGIRYLGFSGIKRKVFEAIEKITCFFSTHIILDSVGNQEYCLDNGIFIEGKSKVIGKGSACGVNLQVFNIKLKREYSCEIRNLLGINESDIVIGYLGRIIKDKGLEELFEVALGIVRKKANVKFLVVGNAEASDPISKELLSKVYNEKSIHICGFTSSPEKYYAAFDLFVFPSYREGFGGGVVQAAALGVPSLVNNIPPLLDSIGNGAYGFSVDTRNTLAFSTKLEQLISDTSELNNIGQKAYKFVLEHFDQKIWLEQYLEYIESQVYRG